MFKNKFILLFIAAFILNFCLNNTSFSADSIALQSRYPNYSYEFSGKDTFENFNRKMFVLNSKLNKYLIRPLNIAWASVMPQYGINRVENFYANLKFPIRLAGCLLQKDYKSSRSEAVRFLTNTTIGLGGLYDPAKNKFKIEPRQEDMGQVLAYYNFKKGPYLVLPIIIPGSVRDIVGELLDCPLNPASYVIGPVGMAAAAVSVLNGTTYMQPISKKIDSTFADPYEITKQLYGIEKYIKMANLDRKDVFAAKTASQNVVRISNVANPSNLESGLTEALNETLNDNFKANLKADIQLDNYNAQSPIIDSMRTTLFDNQNYNHSIWSEMSVWNKGFDKTIKTSSVNLSPTRQNYKYRYILQKNKTAPLAIIYPSIGEGIMSDQSTSLAKLFFDEGYSVVIQGSAFQWAFVKSMPEDYRPGLPANDAYYSRIVTGKIINSLQSKKACNFSKKILVGTSFGGLTTLFVAAQEENDNTLNISNYISINPPIELRFALNVFDKYSWDWKNNPDDIKMRAAITAQKIIQISQNKTAKNSNTLVQNKTETLPFTEDEAKLAIGFMMKQKLSDLVFTIEKGSLSKKSDLYESINNISFYDYSQKYLQTSPSANQGKSFEQMSYESSLYSLSDFLQHNKKYKIYHSLDDAFVNPEQLAWLKKQSNDKAVYFSNGSHLGFLYRKEFIDAFKKDIVLKNSTPQDEM